MAVGNFQGSASNTNPYSTVALATWSGTTHSLYLIKPTTSTSTLVKQTTTAAAVAAGARQPLVAIDWDGNSVYLGTPIQLTIENLVDTDAIIEEPPKHAYWDPALKRVVTVSRFDSFTTVLSMSTSDQLTSTSKDNSSTAWGNQLSASAYLGWETHGGALFTPKVDISLQADLSAKVGKDYEDNESSYNSSYQSRTVDSTGEHRPRRLPQGAAATARHLALPRLRRGARRPERRQPVLRHHPPRPLRLAGRQRRRADVPLVPAPARERQHPLLSGACQPAQPVRPGQLQRYPAHPRPRPGMAPPPSAPSATSTRTRRATCGAPRP